MRIDRYTKVVLTIIAAALLWIAAGGPTLTPAVEAQGNAPQRVVLVGIEPGSDALPVQITGWRDRRGEAHVFPEPEPVESAREQGSGIPVRGR